MSAADEVRAGAARFVVGCLKSRKRTWKHLTTSDGESVSMQSWLSGDDPARFRVLFDARDPGGRVSLIVGSAECEISLTEFPSLESEGPLLLAIQRAGAQFDCLSGRRLMRAAHEATQAAGSPA